jgi:hypothetical protein
MWWGLLLLLGMALVGPITETIEARWLSRKISEELGQMRMHMRSGHRWDAMRGQWLAEAEPTTGTPGGYGADEMP